MRQARASARQARAAIAAAPMNGIHHGMWMSRTSHPALAAVGVCL
jgi:hypothetical protein